MREKTSGTVREQKEKKDARRLFPVAVSLFLAATSVLSYAQGTPADDYSTGMKLYKEGQHEEALPYIRKAAGDGVMEAEYRLCMMYKKGEGMKSPNAQEAHVWCRKSADQKYGPAEYETAVSFQDGLGVAGDPAKALDYYQKASRQGVPEAQYALGLLYEFGEGGLKQSYYQARTLYIWASGKGYSPATYRTGLMYEEGKGVRPSMAAALLWYKKAAAIGNEEARIRLEFLERQEEEMATAIESEDKAKKEDAGVGKVVPASGKQKQP